MTEADRNTDTKANGETTSDGAETGSASTPGSAPGSGSGSGSGKATESAPPGSSPPGAQAADEKNEVAKLRDQYLRTAADFENYRKRTRREVDDAQRRGRESALKDLLPVFDDLDLASKHVTNATDVKSVVDGLRMVLNRWGDTLERMGVKRIPTVGTPFDPAVHEAIQHLESPDQPAGVVLAEVRPGYTMGDYLIRAAMVVVSKGPPGGASMAS